MSGDEIQDCETDHQSRNTGTTVIKGLPTTAAATTTTMTTTTTTTATTALVALLASLVSIVKTNTNNPSSRGEPAFQVCLQMPLYL